MLKKHLQVPAFYQSSQYVYLFQTEEEMNLAMGYPGSEEDAGPTGFVITNAIGRFGTQALTIVGDLEYWHMKLGFKIRAIEPGQTIFMAELKDFVEDLSRFAGANLLSNLKQRKWVGAKVIVGENIGWIIPRYWMKLELINTHIKK